MCALPNIDERSPTTGAGRSMAERRRVSPGAASRSAETEVITAFLNTSSHEPAGLVVEGEPGIGKTTLWLDAMEHARGRGFRVLSARAAATESGYAYASLADLLRGVEAAVLDQLPEPQKVAVDLMLLRVSGDSAATDQRAVSAAFLSIVETLAEMSPILIAIDDLQWLDHSSRYVLTFAGRRLAGGVGVLTTLRTSSGSDHAPGSWLQLPKPDSVARIHLRPLDFGALNVVVSKRLKKTFPRPAMTRIYELSGGNPFYAIEIARGLGTRSPVGEVALPRTLSEVVQSRLGSLESVVGSALLAMACHTPITTGEIARATGIDSDQLLELLEEVEAKGIIEMSGDRLQFAHPLLARGVYDSAAPTQRRMMHRRLGQIVDQLELRARHLALGATRGDLTILQALDTAAASAGTRGAPDAAAELLELAMQLGGDTPQRRIETAAHHFDAGDPGRARSLLEQTISQMQAGPARAAALHLLALVRLYGDSWGEAAQLLKRGIEEAAENAPLRVQMLVAMAFALVNTGDMPGALSTIDDAVAAADELGQPPLISQALGMRVVLRVMRGDGYDEASMRQAMTHADRHAKVPLAFRATVQNAMLLGWMGQLEGAHEQMLSIRRDCMERGEEGELMFVGFHMVVQAIWRGDFTEAALIADDAMERAEQLGGDFPKFIGLTVRATVATYAGDEHAARRDIAEALAAGQRSNAHTLMQWTVDVLGFLEVSLGNYEAALTTLQPRLSLQAAMPDSTEIISAGFIPDAIEALIQADRIDEAESLASTLQRNGERLDRPWLLAVGARCRSILLAAHGDLDDALRFAERAMAQHDRLPMPFERARTQLLLGQLQRRHRRRDAAAATLRAALATFERLNAPLWAARARSSLERADVQSLRTSLLTASERRVAELAASGMTNRDVAGALFISVKTVEVNLTRTYRKLDIRSRAELGRRIDQLDGQTISHPTATS
jgi:ATP/maltotriose-dependent transcriptional regulator MalT